MRDLWRRNRVGLTLGGTLLLLLVAAALVLGGGRRGDLDPAAYDPHGAHALAVLLGQQGVTVTRTTDVPGTLHEATRDSTVFVALPALLSPEELQALAGGPGEVVVADADPVTLAAMGTDVRVVGFDDPRVRPPRCADQAATNAGTALTGGFSYGRAGCYGSGRGRAAVASLVREDRLVLLGTSQGLTNAHLGEDGNAALAIGLLGAHSRVLWLVPSPTRAAFGHRPVRSPDQLLPHWLHLVRWQLLVAAVVLALWRGRRLGRVVLERLPVVVRASETVEGHGRMYQVAGARGTAAEALRESARRRLGRLARGGAVAPQVLADLVAARSGRAAADVQRLLYGPTPVDDVALVRLAADLDALVHDTLDREAAGT